MYKEISEISVESPDDKNDKRVSATLSHLEKAEIPARPSTLEAIRKILEWGPDIQVQALIEVTRSDPALFRACISTLTRHRAGDERAGDLLAILHRIPTETVIEIFSQLVTDFEKLANSSISPHELIQYERTTVRCAASQEFAERSNKLGHQLDKAIAHAAAYFSEIGGMLIAAQFPRLFDMARTKTSKGNPSELGIEIKKRLGISPEAVGIHFAKQAGIYSEVIQQLPRSQMVEQPKQEQLTPLGAAMKTGELVADLHQSNGTGAAYEAWRAFAPTLEIFIGSEGAATFANDVANIVKPVFSELRTIAPEAASKILPAHIRSKIDENKSLPRCEKNLRVEIEKLYASLDSPESAQKALHLFLAKVVPMAGFIGGGIFKYLTQKNGFTCLLSIGKRPSRTYDPSKYFSTTDFISPSQGSSTLRMEIGTEDCFLINCYMGRFATKKAVGIFVLELAPQLELEREQALIHFNALKNVLEECLNSC